MKRAVPFIIILFLFSGCLVRTYTIQKPRQDIEIKGNQGFLYGSPPSSRPTSPKKERQVPVIEVELGEHLPEYEATPSSRKETTALKETQQKIPQETSEGSTLEKEIYQEEGIVEKIPVATLEKKLPRYYTIQKNDTLQKISYKFYGTTKKWKMLFEANKDIIRDPNKIYPGLKIRIP